MLDIKLETFHDKKLPLATCYEQMSKETLKEATRSRDSSVESMWTGPFDQNFNIMQLEHKLPLKKLERFNSKRTSFSVESEEFDPAQNEL